LNPVNISRIQRSILKFQLLDPFEILLSAVLKNINVYKDLEFFLLEPSITYNHRSSESFRIRFFPRDESHLLSGLLT